MFSKDKGEENIWRNGFLFALILLILLGSCLIWIGANKYPPGSFLHVFLVGVGISMAPASLIGILFRVFLFKEVKYQLTSPILDEIRQELAPEVKAEVDKIVRDYREEIESLRSLKNAGMIRSFSRREDAIKYFRKPLIEEQNDIMIVGSSLKGLLQMEEYKEIRDVLRMRIEKKDLRVRFMLTHPVIADFRVCQENRRFSAIGKEIIRSLEILKEWKVPPKNVCLFKGTPTCFAIKTAEYMLLDIYPYCDVAYFSPCFIVKTSSEHPSYIYDAFNKTHFSAWETALSEVVNDYDGVITNLRKNLQNYANKAAEILEIKIR